MEAESNSNEEISLEKARKLLADGKLEDSLAIARNYWLKNPRDGQAAALVSELMKEAGRLELSTRLEELAKSLPGAEDTQASSNEPAQELFDAGFGLIDARQHELAAMLLNRCADLLPEEPVVNYELGFALMSLRRFQQAIPYFEYVESKGGDFDTLLNLTACYTMVRRVEKAQETLKKIEKLKLDQEQTHELNYRRLVLRRLQTLSDRTQLSARDWLYVLYGSILMRPSRRDQVIKEDVISIATMLAVLKGLLEGLGIELDVVEFYGPQSRPLAQALAELLEIPTSSYQGPQRAERALLTMSWATDIIGPHQSFVPNEDRRALFAYSLTWDEPLPLVPEIIGCMGYDEPMPWRQGTSTFPATNDTILTQDEFDSTVESTYKSILYHARDLEADPSIVHSVQEALDYYSDKTRLLVLRNSGTFQKRSEYSAELP